SFTALQLRRLLWVLLICRWLLFPALNNYPEFRVKCVCSYHLTMKKVGFWTGNVVIFLSIPVSEGKLSPGNNSFFFINKSRE
ncbi:hypothetical protein, partial [Salmonella enterica]|uniref:hypothetical protein n=1 Tax=Salmonella enterica TaxID=28901 RepID=UPI001C3130F4